MTIAAFVVAALRRCSTDYWPIADDIGQGFDNIEATLPPSAVGWAIQHINSAGAFTPAHARNLLIALQAIAKAQGGGDHRGQWPL